ncbi:MAG TPA: hypothetical protein PKA64_14340 [Myxococcota bacterium]|nr:hypothetical protein [Myxococcota bacterium]
MRALALVALAVAAPALAGNAGVIFNTSGAYAVGPSGPATARFQVDHPTGAHAVLTPSQSIGEGDFNWLQIPLTLPVSDDAGRVAGVSVCFRTNSPTGSAWISQTRLVQQMSPGPSTVVFDDGTDHMDPVGGCYTATVPGGLVPGGVVQLNLKVVMNVGDTIEVTGGFLRMTPR